MKEKVLYCGMADDILTPLILVPNFTKLFVIDLFDSAFAKHKTWEGQKKDILQCLKLGNNKNSHHRDVYLYYDKETPVYSINGLCKIIKESDVDKKWVVSFIYNGVERELIYFHHTDFITKWDEQINEITDLMCMGDEFLIENKMLNKMIKKRCNFNCKFYDQFTESDSTTKTNVIGREIFINDLQNVLDSVEKLS
jgi:hypothetical protein